ncbi:hypothetical protein [Paraburkholderia nodosa]|uniref:hypothetical protein n=1 Tax=Paraburkholderia nodosa TaxID=392320 RepID=UPI00159EFA94|nr:hypothetical protein [Paraburkholderia nodosa]
MQFSPPRGGWSDGAALDVPRIVRAAKVILVGRRIQVKPFEKQLEVDLFKRPGISTVFLADRRGLDADVCTTLGR